MARRPARRLRQHRVLVARAGGAADALQEGLRQATLLDDSNGFEARVRGVDLVKEAAGRVEEALWLAGHRRRGLPPARQSKARMRRVRMLCCSPPLHDHLQWEHSSRVGTCGAPRVERCAVSRQRRLNPPTDKQMRVRCNRRQ